MTRSRTSRTFGSAAGLGLSLGLAGCGGSGSASYQNPQGQVTTTSAQYGPLLMTLTTINAATPGPSIVPINLTVRNVSHDPVTLAYVPGPDASVSQNGQEVWNDGNGVAYGTALVPLTLAPGESHPFSTVWPKINNEDPKNPAQPVTRGQYVIKAWEVLRINGQTVTDAIHTAPPITVTVE